MISLVKVLSVPSPPSPPAEQRIWSGRVPLVFDLLFTLIYVKPALNVSTVFACQWGLNLQLVISPCRQPNHVPEEPTLLTSRWAQTAEERRKVHEGFVSKAVLLPLALSEKNCEPGYSDRKRSLLTVRKQHLE